eukprot:scaffold116775_cov29-Prasinocladus_malaysianus.AAC.3
MEAADAAGLSGVSKVKLGRLMSKHFGLKSAPKRVGGVRRSVMDPEVCTGTWVHGPRRLRAAQRDPDVLDRRESDEPRHVQGLDGRGGARGLHEGGDVRPLAGAGLARPVLAVERQAAARVDVGQDPVGLLGDLRELGGQDEPPFRMYSEAFVAASAKRISRVSFPADAALRHGHLPAEAGGRKDVRPAPDVLEGVVVAAGDHEAGRQAGDLPDDEVPQGLQPPEFAEASEAEVRCVDPHQARAPAQGRRVPGPDGAGGSQPDDLQGREAPQQGEVALGRAEAQLRQMHEASAEAMDGLEHRPSQAQRLQPRSRQDQRPQGVGVEFDVNVQIRQSGEGRQETVFYFDHRIGLVLQVQLAQRRRPRERPQQTAHALPVRKVRLHVQIGDPVIHVGGPQHRRRVP